MFEMMGDRGFSQFPVVNEDDACIGTLNEKTVFDAAINMRTARSIRNASYKN